MAASKNLPNKVYVFIDHEDSDSISAPMLEKEALECFEDGDIVAVYERVGVFTVEQSPPNLVPYKPSKRRR